jgi:putative transposase
MRRSHVNILLHFAWATRARAQLIPLEHLQAVHEVLKAEAASAGCQVLAVGGTGDHVHMLLAVPATAAPADVMRRLKSVSTRAAKGSGLAWFGWQDNCGVTSVSPRDKALVTRYILEQRERHQSGAPMTGAEVPWQEVASHEER